jgi:hypothetical protein
MYWPDERYEQGVPGATFTLREGPHAVGFGQVLDRSELVDIGQFRKGQV